MSPLQKIIHKAQKDMYCPTCGRNFSVDEIHLRGLFKHMLLLQTVCAKGHSPIIMVFVTNYYQQDDKLNPIDTDDVLAIQTALQKFDGDFASLWRKRKDNSNRWKV